MSKFWVIVLQSRTNTIDRLFAFDYGMLISIVISIPKVMLNYAYKVNISVINSSFFWISSSLMYPKNIIIDVFIFLQKHIRAKKWNVIFSFWRWDTFYAWPKHYYGYNENNTNYNTNTIILIRGITTITEKVLKRKRWAIFYNI